MTLILAAIFNFGMVVFILWFFGRKPIAAFLATRSSEVATAIQDAERLSAESAALLQKWDSSFRACEAHAKQQFDEAQAALKRIRETTLKNAKTEADRVKQEAKLVGTSEAARAQDSLRHEIAQASVKMAEKFLASHLTEKDQRQLITESVEGITNGSQR